MDVLSLVAAEQGTYVIIVSFADEDGASMTPDSIEWKLSDTSGNVINERTEETITPDAEITIVLSGLDLAITSSSDSGIRALTITGEYTSDLGASLPFSGEVLFQIENFIGI